MKKELVWLMRSYTRAIFPKENLDIASGYFLSASGEESSAEDPEDRNHDSYAYEVSGGCKRIHQINYQQTLNLVDAGIMSEYSLEEFNMKETLEISEEVKLNYGKEYTKITFGITGDLLDKHSYNSTKGYDSFTIKTNLIQNEEDKDIFMNAIGEIIKYHVSNIVKLWGYYGRCEDDGDPYHAFDYSKNEEYFYGDFKNNIDEWVWEYCMDNMTDKDTFTNHDVEIYFLGEYLPPIFKREGYLTNDAAKSPRDLMTKVAVENINEIDYFIQEDGSLVKQEKTIEEPKPTTDPYKLWQNITSKDKE